MTLKGNNKFDTRTKSLFLSMLEGKTYSFSLVLFVSLFVVVIVGFFEHILTWKGKTFDCFDIYCLCSSHLFKQYFNDVVLATFIFIMIELLSVL